MARGRGRYRGLNKKESTTSHNNQQPKFPSNMETTASILRRENLSFNLLNSYVYVDLSDVTINPYDYLRTASSPSVTESRKNLKPAKNTLLNDSNISLDKKVLRKRLDLVPKQIGRRQLRNNKIETVDLVSDNDDDDDDDDDGDIQQPSTSKTPPRASKLNKSKSSEKRPTRSRSISASQIKNIESSLAPRKSLPSTSHAENLPKRSPRRRRQESENENDLDKPDNIIESKILGRGRKSKRKNSEVNNSEKRRTSTTNNSKPNKKTPKETSVDASDKVAHQKTQKGRKLSYSESSSENDANDEEINKKRKNVSESPEVMVVSDSEETEENVTKQTTVEQNIVEISDIENIIGKPETLEVPEHVDEMNIGDESTKGARIQSNGFATTQDLIEVLAGSDEPEVSDDAAMDESLNSEKLEASKKVAAESTELVRNIADDVTDGESHSPAKPDSGNETENAVEIETLEQSINDSLNVSVNKSATKKRAPFKIRFSKGFEYSKFTCDTCQKMFKKSADLSLHLLQHLDNRDLSVRVFRAILPKKFDTSCHDMDKYLKPKKKRPITPFDVDEAKSLMSKYCRDDSFLEPFEDTIDGDISMNQTNGDAVPTVVVLSDITLVSPDKPEHSVEIDVDQLQEVTSDKSTSPIQELSENDEEPINVDSQTEDIDQDTEIIEFKHRTTASDADIDVKTTTICEVVELKGENQVEECIMSTDEVEDVVPEAQEEVCVITDEKENEEVTPKDLEINTENEVVPDSQEYVCVEKSEEVIQDNPEMFDKSTDNEEVIPDSQEEVYVLTEEIISDDQDIFDRNTDAEEIIPETQEECVISEKEVEIGFTDTEDQIDFKGQVEQVPSVVAEDENDVAVLQLHDEEHSVQEVTNESLNSDDLLKDKSDSEDAKKRKRDDVEEEDTEDSNKKLKLVDDSDAVEKDLSISLHSDDYVSCVDETSPSHSPSKRSDTSESDNVDLMKFASLDNQMKSLIDKHKETLKVSEDLDSTMTESEVREGTDDFIGDINCKPANDENVVSSQCSIAL